MTAKTWDELYGEGAETDKPPQTPISDETVAKLEGYSREELVALIKRVSGAVWGYAMLDDTEKSEAARLKLYNMGMSATEVHKVVPALDKWFDRTQGKAPQSIAMTVEDKGISTLSDERLMRLERELSKVIGCESVIIPPMPSKLAN